MYTVINLDDLCTCAIATPLGRYLYESARTCDHPDDKITLYYTYNRPLISYDSSIDAKTAKRYSKHPYPFRAPDLEYHRHEPYLTSNGSLHIRTKRHSPDDVAFQHALREQTFPLPEAIRKMEQNEPTFLGTFFPVRQPLQEEEQVTFEDTQSTFSFSSSHPNAHILDPMNTNLANFIFNIITLINALTHCCLLIMLKLSFRQGGWFNEFVVKIVQTIVAQKTVRCVKLLAPDTEQKTSNLLDLDFDWPLTTSSPPSSQIPLLSSAQTAILLSILKAFSILVALLLLPLILWLIFRYLLTPFFYKSNVFRQLCIGCFYNSTFRRPPTTDIFLDVIHIHSGSQIRIYISTISAPACALSFTGTVMLQHFKVDVHKLQLVVHIDWHNCLLIYNNFVIPLPATGTAFPFQPNLLTDFTRKGPFNIVLLARYMDQLIQIPHLDQVDTLPPVERLDFPLSSPYQKVHDEVKALMPLA